jgi:hypothetical protein
MNDGHDQFIAEDVDFDEFDMGHAAESAKRQEAYEFAKYQDAALIQVVLGCAALALLGVLEILYWSGAFNAIIDWLLY